MEAPLKAIASLALLLTIMYALAGPSLVPLLPLLTGIGVISGLTWTYLSIKLTPRLVSQKRGLFFKSPEPPGSVGIKEYIYHSFMPALFIFSVALLVADIVGVSLSSGSGLIKMTVYALLLLPLVFVSSSKLSVSKSGIAYVDGVHVKELDLYPYFEEFTGFGSILGVAIYTGDLYRFTIEELGKLYAEAGLKVTPIDVAIAMAVAMSYVLSYFLHLMYPSMLATLIYLVAGYRRSIGSLHRKLKPALLKPELRFRCFRCGAQLTGVEAFCPKCGAAIRPL